MGRRRLYHTQAADFERLGTKDRRALDNPVERMDTSNLEQRRKRAHYRANHRGTKEMDWLLGRFADEAVFTMAGETLAAFETLLEVSDDRLHDWLMQPQLAGGEIDRTMIVKIRAFHGLSDD